MVSREAARVNASRCRSVTASVGSGILAGVRPPLAHPSRSFLIALLLACIPVLVGCASFWVAPAPAPTTPRPTNSPSPTPSAQPTALPTFAPRPSPTPGQIALQISDQPLQFWSNPNEIVGLLWDGATVWAATLGGVVRWWPDGRNELYSAETGLVSQAIAAIARDADGHIWVGYRDAPAWSEYDGETWLHYPTRQDAVEARYAAMLAAPSGDPRLWTSQPGSAWLWLPRGNGQAQAYDGQRWRSYMESHGVTPGTWGVSLSPFGRVWAIGRGMATAMEGELWWDDHALFSSIASPNLATDLAVDEEGGAWVTFVGERGAEGGVARYNAELERWEGHQHTVNPAIPSQVYSIAIERDGTVLIGGQDALAVRRPQRAWRAIPAPGVQVLSLARGDGETFWLGASDGLWAMQSDGSDLRGPLSVPTPLHDNQVRALLALADGSLLVAGPRGVSLIGADGQVEWIALAGTRCAASRADGSVWLGGDAGVFSLDPVSRFPSKINPLPVIDMALADEALVLLGVDGVLYRLATGDPEPLVDAQHVLGSRPRNLTVDAAGVVWLSSETGVGMLTADGSLAVVTRGEGLLTNDVRAVAADGEGVVWYATAMGLVRLRPDGRWTRFTVESTGGGLRSMSMTALHVEPDGTLWMATDLGLSRRSPDADWSYYDLGGIRQIVTGADGAAWLGSDSGLYRLDRSALVLVAE
jgi:ligand-binding sensor domain-containing protein